MTTNPECLQETKTGNCGFGIGVSINTYICLAAEFDTIPTALYSTAHTKAAVNRAVKR